MRVRRKPRLHEELAVSYDNIVHGVSPVVYESDTKEDTHNEHDTGEQERERDSLLHMLDVNEWGNEHVPISQADIHTINNARVVLSVASMIAVLIVVYVLVASKHTHSYNSTRVVPIEHDTPISNNAEQLIGDTSSLISSSLPFQSYRTRDW